MLTVDAVAQKLTAVLGALQEAEGVLAVTFGIESVKEQVSLALRAAQQMKVMCDSARRLFQWRDTLEKSHGKVWDKDEMESEFELLGIANQYAMVQDRITGKKGSLEFRRDPWFFWGWKGDPR